MVIIDLDELKNIQIDRKKVTQPGEGFPIKLELGKNVRLNNIKIRGIASARCYVELGEVLR